MIRNARCYTADPVTTVLADVVEARTLGLVLDVDALERSAFAKIDRVMLLALQSLSRSGVQLVFAARHERERGERLHAMLGRSWLALPERAVQRLRDGIDEIRIIAIGDDPALLGSLSTSDRGVSLGRPELSRANVVCAGDTTVRATLWWIVDERGRGAS